MDEKIAQTEHEDYEIIDDDLIKDDIKNIVVTQKNNGLNYEQINEIINSHLTEIILDNIRDEEKEIEENEGFENSSDEEYSHDSFQIEC